jgi:hypothetical protein
MNGWRFAEDAVFVLAIAVPVLRKRPAKLCEAVTNPPSFDLRVRAVPQRQSNAHGDSL